MRRTGSVVEGFAVEGNGIVDAGGFVADFDFALVADVLR